MDNLLKIQVSNKQKRSEFLEWLGSDLVKIAENLVSENKFIDSFFVKKMKKCFKSDRFELFVKEWIVDYYFYLFFLLEDSILNNKGKEIVLEDNHLNRHGICQYKVRFKNLPKISWKKPRKMIIKILSIFIQLILILYNSLKNGLKFSNKIFNYSVMREAVYGLYNIGGYYFHDDFLVDGIKIKKSDILFFSRGIPSEKIRLKAYYDLKKSEYAHFNINELSLSAKVFITRVLPKYIGWGGICLLSAFRDANFSFFSSIFSLFVKNALPYEKIFSNYCLISELGQNYFLANEIAESVICQNYNVKYYLFHWSDNSLSINRFATAFLGCDKFLIWGSAHIQNEDKQNKIFKPIGYMFKQHIKTVKSNKSLILSRMGINTKGKVISFFDESFGSKTKMTEQHYINFWATILKLALELQEDTFLIKQKGLYVRDALSFDFKEKFEKIKISLEKLENVYILDSNKWSFIEVIGVSDIVITQGLSSSATIAIICGIEGLYLDEAGYDHPFRKFFKDKIVFDSPERIITAIKNIISNKESNLKDIPEDLLREYDFYPDNHGLERLRDIVIHGQSASYGQESGENSINIGMVRA